MTKEMNMANIHIVLQGKGGVGKSVVAAFLAQQQQAKGKDILAIDTDPVNATFSGYKGLKVQNIDIMKNDDINPRKFDELIEMIYESETETVIIDNGSSSFIALSSYLKNNEAIQLLTNHGHKVHIHTVVTAGQAQKDTLLGFKSVIEDFSESGAAIVVWQNEYWGQIEANGKRLEQMKVYIDNKKFVHAIIIIPQLKSQTFSQDLHDILTKKQTFDEAIIDESTQLMAKQRLQMIKAGIFSNMELALQG